MANHDDEDDGVDDSKPVRLVGGEFLSTAFWNASRSILAVAAGVFAMTGVGFLYGFPLLGSIALLSSFAFAYFDLSEANENRADLRTILRYFARPGPNGTVPLTYMLDYAPLLGLAAACLIDPTSVASLFSAGYGQLAAIGSAAYFLSSFLGRASDQDLVPYTLTQTSTHSDRLGLAILSSLLVFGVLTGGSSHALAGLASFLPSPG